MKLSKDTQGSTLTWVMITGIVLTLVIASVVTIINYNYSSTMVSQERTQAYYTAQSLNERIVNWLSGVPGGPDAKLDPLADNIDQIEDQFHFIEGLKTAPVREEYDENDIGANMGTATALVEFTSDDYDEIRITTIGRFAGKEETIVSYMYLQNVSNYTFINTDFNYLDPVFSRAIGEVSESDEGENIRNWSQGPDTVFCRQFLGGGTWWHYFAIPTIEHEYVDYRMDLLAIQPGAFTNQVPRTDYCYLYLQNTGYNQGVQGKKDVHIELYPGRGSFVIETSAYTSNGARIEDNMVGVGNFPYVKDRYTQVGDLYAFSNTARRATVKGVLLSISNVGGTDTRYVSHDRIVYYTRDYPNLTNDDWPDITLGTYYSGGTAAASLRYNNLSLYITDRSDKEFNVSSGIEVTSGTMYTMRDTNIGVVVDDTGNSGRNSITRYALQTNLVFQTYNFVFADPGEGQTRTSRIQGAGSLAANYPNANPGATRAKTYMNNGSILIKNRHTLTISDGSVINAQDNRGIVVETGGTLIIESGAQVSGNIYVQQGATLKIAVSSTAPGTPPIITGNIFCSGELIIETDFYLNPLDSNPDNIALGYVSNPTDFDHNASGIFIYNDKDIGTGSLIVTGNPTISSSGGTSPSNRIHTFVPYPNLPDHLFCDDVDDTTHRCQAWDSSEYIWQPKPSSMQTP